MADQQTNVTVSVVLNEDELQWEDSLLIAGRPVPLAITNAYSKEEAQTLAYNTQVMLNDRWTELVRNVLDSFLTIINNRRLFRGEKTIATDDYQSSLYADSITVLEDKIVQIKLKDGGVSGNSRLIAYINADGSIRVPTPDFWEEERLIRGEHVLVSVSNEFVPEQIETVIRAVEAKINEQWQEIESVLATYLLPGYNESWRLPSEPELSAEKFLQHIQLSGVHIMEDLSFDLYFIDNELFGGHFVEMFVDGEGMLYEPSLYG